MTSIVSLKNVVKSYKRGKQSVEVLHGLNLEVPQGDFVALMGPSGSGKTTLLNLIGGLDQPTSAKSIVAGERIDRLSGSALAKWRARHVGFVFQFYNLMPMLSAERNVELPLLLTIAVRVEAQAERAAPRCRSWALPTARSTSRASCPAASSSASRSRARSSPIRRCWCAMSPPAISTARRPMRSWACCARSTASTRRPSSWSPTIQKAADYASRELFIDKGTLVERRCAERSVKFLPLLWSGLWRKRTRTIFTLLSIVTAFLLFGMLQGVIACFRQAAWRPPRWTASTVVSKVSFTEPLPYQLSLADRDDPGSRRGVLPELVRRLLPGPKNMSSPSRSIRSAISRCSRS